MRRAPHRKVVRNLSDLRPPVSTAAFTFHAARPCETGINETMEAFSPERACSQIVRSKPQGFAAPLVPDAAAFC